ncbi:Fur-regulated basic protein FbpA [Metabacillus fastidiosus]|uniref:Fur-regulated basic protein FbpA n=1 Tax=Metabacillus fastidiosus TaxID=1458 RepID=UPI003D272796
MNDPANQLRRAVEQQKDVLKDDLLRMGYYKTDHGKQLYELTLSELQLIHTNVKASFESEEIRFINNA